MKSLRQVYDEWRDSMHYQYNCLEPQFKLLEIITQHLIEDMETAKAPYHKPIINAPTMQSDKWMLVEDFQRKYLFISSSHLRNVISYDSDFETKCTRINRKNNLIELNTFDVFNFFLTTSRYIRIRARLKKMIDKGQICLP